MRRRSVGPGFTGGSLRLRLAGAAKEESGSYQGKIRTRAIQKRNTLLFKNVTASLSFVDKEEQVQNSYGLSCAKGSL